MERLTDTFTVTTDDGTQNYEVHEFTEYSDVSAFGSQTRETIEGIKRYVTSEGDAVNYVEKDDTYKIITPSGVVNTRRVKD